MEKSRDYLLEKCLVACDSITKSILRASEQGGFGGPSPSLGRSLLQRLSSKPSKYVSNLCRPDSYGHIL